MNLKLHGTQEYNNKMANACILYMEGTNCEDETKKAFESVGINAELVHIKQLTGNVPTKLKRSLESYDILMIPGGWSAGDYVRAGAIFAARIKSSIMPEITAHVDEGKFVLGVCNGFQVLTELGLLPGFNGPADTPEAALTTNQNGHFECRPVYLKHSETCQLTESIAKNAVLQVPVAHAEGRFTFSKDVQTRFLDRLVENNQIVFKYCKDNGTDAEGEYPWNPNGSLADIAGICNPEGNVLGMMPHPERVMDNYQQSDWTRNKDQTIAGRIFFESIAKKIE